MQFYILVSFGPFWVCFEERKRRIWILFLVLSEYRLRLWLFVVKTNHKPAFVSCLPARFDSRLEHAWLILTQLDSFSHRSRIRRQNRIIWKISEKTKYHGHGHFNAWSNFGIHISSNYYMHHFKGYKYWLKGKIYLNQPKRVSGTKTNFLTIDENSENDMKIW